MKTFGRAVVLVMGSVLVLSAVRAAHAAPVLSVISVKVTGDMEKYLEKVEKIQAASKRLGLPTPRLWRATLAGPDAGIIHIAAEHPSLTAYAEAMAKTAGDPQWQKALKDLDKSGLRTIVSSSLLVEVMP